MYHRDSSGHLKAPSNWHSAHYWSQELTAIDAFKIDISKLHRDY